MDCKPIFEQVRRASRTLNLIKDEQINQILIELANTAESKINEILIENQKDLALMSVDNPKYDRLKLTSERIKSIADDIRNVASLPSPLGRVLHDDIRPNNLHITKVSVPFGVIGIIYEARPNVTFDVFSLCFKSGNACILKGGSDANFSNTIISGIIQDVLERNNISKDVVTLLPTGREETAQLLNARGYVDLIIPRGSQELINFVRDNATIPVIETGAGICHTYFDEFGDVEKGKAIINNAKTRRVSVCNALDCLILHASRLSVLPEIVKLMEASNVIIYADDKSYKALEGNYPKQLLEHATIESFGTEFLSYKMAIKTVETIDEALDHIAEYSSKHSEAIVSENTENVSRFLKSVDASSVYSNASTAFTDGAQFGLGAEIGISTQKLHARGPMALDEITSYKWIIEGDGHIRK